MPIDFETPVPEEGRIFGPPGSTVPAVYRDAVDVLDKYGNQPLSAAEAEAYIDTYIEELDE